MKKIFILGLLVLSYQVQAATFNIWPGLTSSKPWMTDVAKVAECVLKDDDFLTEVGNFKKYTFTDQSPKAVEALMRSTKKDAVYSTYWAKKKSTVTVAFRNKGSNIVYLNLWKHPKKKNRAMDKMVATYIHEWLHILGFGHGSNNMKGKEDSVPYMVATISKKYSIKYLGGCQ
jgi:hypothetical protein